MWADYDYETGGLGGGWGKEKKIKQNTKRHITKHILVGKLFTCVGPRPSVDFPPVDFGGSITRSGDTLSPNISLTGRTRGGLDMSD